MARVEIDKPQLQSELGSIVGRQAPEFLRPAADLLVRTAKTIAASHFPRVPGLWRGPRGGVASIHCEFFPASAGMHPEYRVSYDGDHHPYMGLWELGTRIHAPRPYLRPAVDIVNRIVKG